MDPREGPKFDARCKKQGFFFFSFSLFFPSASETRPLLFSVCVSSFAAPLSFFLESNKEAKERKHRKKTGAPPLVSCVRRALRLVRAPRPRLACVLRCCWPNQKKEREREQERESDGTQQTSAAAACGLLSPLFFLSAFLSSRALSLSPSALGLRAYKMNSGAASARAIQRRTRAINWKKKRERKEIADRSRRRALFLRPLLPLFPETHPGFSLPPSLSHLSLDSLSQIETFP